MPIEPRWISYRYRGGVNTSEEAGAESPSESQIDAQGRLLAGTDGGIWSGAGDDLLIGGRTTFDFDTDGNDFLLWRQTGTLDTSAQTFDGQFRGGVTVAVGDMEGSKIAAGTQLASVTDLVIDPFNSDAGYWEMHDLLLANQDNVDGGKFVYLYYTTTTPNGEVDGGLLSTVDHNGITATMAEYALFA